MSNKQKVIEIKNIRKDFGNRTVLKDVNFNVHEGEVVSIIGSSGSGKSTLLRCINLLETPTSGQILIHGKDVLSGDVPLVELREKVGMVFQQFNLFNNLINGKALFCVYLYANLMFIPAYFSSFSPCFCKYPTKILWFFLKFGQEKKRNCTKIVSLLIFKARSEAV